MASRSEFACHAIIEPWPEGGFEMEVEATAEERHALARRFALVELSSLTASAKFDRSADGRELRLRGQLRASVVQSCVVSLDPVASHLEEAIERRYRRLEPGEAMPEPELLVDPDAAEVEFLRGASVDLGEVVAEELGLALDPYPRAGNAHERLPQLGADVSLGEAGPAPSPFAVLEDLYDKADSAR